MRPWGPPQYDPSMSFGLGRGRVLDDAPGVVGIDARELPPLPDDVATDRMAGYLDPRKWFAHPERPLEIEIGSGKGTFLIQHAELHPNTNFLGIEWAREFYEYAADRIRRRRAGLVDEEEGADALEAPPPPARALTNVRLLHTDASEFLRWRVGVDVDGRGFVRVIHLYFSDPWPKSKHHRRRVVQDQFLHEAARVLEHGGELRIVTDHAELWAWDVAHLRDWARDPLGLLAEGVGMAPPAEALAAATADVARNRREFPAAAKLAPLSDADRPFELARFDPPASAGPGELVGTNFERKYAREGRPFHAIIARKAASAAT